MDVLVNNAGRSQRAMWKDIKIQVDRELFDTNVFGLLNLSRIVIPYFLSKKQGHVAVSSSVCGKYAPPCSASYNATKHALHVTIYIYNYCLVSNNNIDLIICDEKGYFETLRSEMQALGVSVTMLCLGPFFSELLSACATETPGQVAQILIRIM